MSSVIISLIEETRSQHFETASNAIMSIALLLERVSMSRESDTSYKSLLPQSLYEHKVSPEDFDALVRAATGILRDDSRFTGSAAWALGKTYSAKVVPELVASLRDWQVYDDFTTHNILVALDNCGGLTSTWGSVEEIARAGGNRPASMEFAKTIISRTGAS